MPFLDDRLRVWPFAIVHMGQKLVRVTRVHYIIAPADNCTWFTTAADPHFTQMPLTSIHNWTAQQGYDAPCRHFDVAQL